ncbi:mannonate dehydratase [Aurantibacter crassamenti]|uniref:mannonate dehydratase n=1 Tax=Aurantibacter crassamenti TaxID=1837375 RepID=UPI001939CA7F|nr:mannonate dehydratase [Aurantibacter crassamenti]MBM1105756.1 mannonate dehydratase [Aurantibacter crassamenti]
MDKHVASSTNKQGINRRKVLSTLLKGGLGATAIGTTGLLSTSCAQTEKKAEKNETVAAVTKKPILYNVGCQHGGTGKQNLEFLARYGVFNMDGGSPKFIEGVGWDLDDSMRKRDACEKYGIKLDAYHLPLSSAGIENISTPNIMLGKSPARDREIELIQQMITVASKTGVKVLNYNTIIHVILRTGDTLDTSRGNTYYRSWNLEEALAKNEGLTIAGKVDIDEIYERITYFLDRVIPVAEEYNVKLANHIADPPAPVGYRGITRWNSPDVFEGIKRFAQLYDSPAHGFNLCLGSTAEGLQDPRTEILPIIKWVGERKQIFNIHLRNIKGKYNNFQEVYPDNGDMDFGEILVALRDVGYDAMVMPDHIPHHEDPAAYLQGHAYAFGYIKALMHAIDMNY